VGVSHACGHDIHTAVQLGVASVLASLRDELPGTVKFIFQPAEEGPPPGEEGGAELMLAEGVLENPRPQAVFGLHAFSEMEVGTVAYGAAFELDYDRGTPATINDRELTAQMVPTLERLLGAERVILIPPTMGGEDFAIFANEVPGFFFRLGQVGPGTTSGGHHTPTFRADDAAVPIGMRVMSTLLVDYLAAAAGE